MTAEARFFAKTVISDGCWHWTGKPNESGYGVLKVEDRIAKAHRFAYELLVGPIPDGLELDHTCHTADPSCAGGVTCPHRLCVNPSHLEPVTKAENAYRSPLTRQGANLRKTHCLNGHPFDEANTIRYGTHRHCLACRRDRDRVSA